MPLMAYPFFAQEVLQEMFVKHKANFTVNEHCHLCKRAHVLLAYCMSCGKTTCIPCSDLKDRSYETCDYPNLPMWCNACAAEVVYNMEDK